MRTPYEALVSAADPTDIEVWALDSVPDSPLTMDEIRQLRVPGVYAADVQWYPAQEKIAGALALRRCNVFFGPLSPDRPSVSVAAVALVDVGSDGGLLDVGVYSGPYSIPENPGQLALYCQLVIGKGGV